MNSSDLNSTRQAALAHAESFLRAARELEGKGLEHIRFHLATLALEETGKAWLLGLEYIASKTDAIEEENVGKELDNHVRKLFWAIWGPAFGPKKYAQEQIDQCRGLATSIHERRLSALYASSDSPLLPKDKMSVADADRLVRMAKIRLELEGDGPIEISPDRLDGVKWLMSVLKDAERAQQVFSNKSLEKLEELGDGIAWISWLQETFQQHEALMAALAEKEIARQRPGEADSKSKWRIKFRVYSHSHSVRQRALNKWNDANGFIQLQATGQRRYSQYKKNEIICQISLSNQVPVAALWYHGWGIARSFVCALNMASVGFFWWYVPSDTRGWYDEIWDLESDAGVELTEGPRLEIDWGNQVLTEDNMYGAAVLFAWMSTVRGTPHEEPLNQYITALVYLSKVDFHMRCEVNAFESFWKCFCEALKAYHGWDGNSDLLEAALEALGDRVIDGANVKSHMDLGKQIAVATKGDAEIPHVTLTEAIGMKWCCDCLFMIEAANFQKKVHAPSDKGAAADELPHA